MTPPGYRNMVDRNLPWSIHTIHSVVGESYTNQQNEYGRWCRAVPVPYQAGLRLRLVAAWWVLTGRAYALRWPKPGELEAALGDPIPKRANNE